jgi:hypothetical protein
MEATKKEELQEQLSKDIKNLNWDIEYHESKLTEAKMKMQIAEYALKQLISDGYAK